MDLLTLIAACALGAAPISPSSGLDRGVMQALIFEQSGGEPWSFSVPGEGFARVLPTMHDALREARAVRPDGRKIHVGLAGLPADPASATALMFAPCPNIALATLEITQFIQRCRMTAKPEPIYCAIAAYHGSWNRPETWFADAVSATVRKRNAPNFEMPKDAYLDTDDVAHTLPRRQHAAPTTPALTLDDRVRSWSSALFPAKPITTNTPSTDLQNPDRAAEQSHSIGTSPQAPPTNKSPGDSLFVQRSSEPK